MLWPVDGKDGMIVLTLNPTPCLPVLPYGRSQSPTSATCSHVELFRVQAQIISQREFTLQWAPGCNPDQRAYYTPVALQPPLSTDSNHHCLPNKKKKDL